MLLRPSGEAIKDGKIEFIIPASLDLTKPLAFGAFARVITDAAGTSSYAMYYYPSSHQVVIGYKVNASAITSIQQHTLLANVGGIPAPAAGDKRVEFIVESANPSTTNLTVNVFDSNGLLFTQTVTDSNTKLQAAGRWGLQSFSNISSTEVAAFDTVTIYSADLPANVDLSLTANKSTVKFSDNVIYTLSDDEDETVILSDNGAGGTFFPSATVILNSGNSYTATVNYTPAKAGTIVISGNPANFTGDLESEIFVSPYSTTIGFIGDSITDGNRCSSNNYPSTIAVGDLGLGFTDIKRGVSGASTQKYLENNLASSITAFTNGGVDVVHIMLGTNDAFINVSYNISTTDYKINMQAIIDALKLAGIRQVVLSYPTYSSVSRDVALLTGYQDKINELVVENG
ncbi:MAG: SGNH/GDSL hydrolase family protein [Candidatus Peribacteria bacterium]|nr:SGNH/GDSL hydrolase family protein [Candidatus Peribacteria bacterium]